jgi:hypothetical protein
MRLTKIRLNHWSCSKFADLIRGEKKPFALGWDEWAVWRKNQKKQRPFRYWLSDIVLPRIQDVFCFPYDLYYTIKIYVKNRFITKTHYLKTNLPKGEWHDLDDRILHGLFNELVEFVEKDLSHLSKWDQTKKYKFKKGRCKEAVDDYFKWVNSLDQKDDQPFKQTQLKIKKLYEWWTIKRNRRLDPYKITKETHGSKYYRIVNEIIETYDKEDDMMLKELISIRRSLWC